MTRFQVDVLALCARELQLVQDRALYGFSVIRSDTGERVDPQDVIGTNNGRMPDGTA